MDATAPDVDRARALRDALRSGDAGTVERRWTTWRAPGPTAPVAARREWIHAATWLRRDRAALDAALAWHDAGAELDVPTLVYAASAARRTGDRAALEAFIRSLEALAPGDVNVVRNRSVLAEWRLTGTRHADRNLVRAKRQALRCLRLVSRSVTATELQRLFARIESLSDTAPLDEHGRAELLALADAFQAASGTDPRVADGIRRLQASLAVSSADLVPVEEILNPSRSGKAATADDALGEALASALARIHLGTASEHPLGHRPRHPLLVPEICLAFQADVDGRLAGWRSSAVYRSFRDAEVERRAERAASATATRRGARANVLVVSSNWNFAAPLLRALQDADWCDVRTFDPRPLRSTSHVPPMRAFSPPRPDASVDAWRRAVAASEWHDRFEWADLCIVDWCAENAVVVSKVLPPRARVVVRLHNFEAFTVYPYVVNWGGVDGLWFVSEPTRRFVVEQHAERLSGIPWIVAGNAMDRPIGTGERTSNGRTLGMLKYAAAYKDPIEALRILRALRTRDAEWTLALAGDPWPSDDALPPHELEYKRAYLDFVREHRLEDAIVYHGYQDDPAAWLRGVDVTLSCSQREGTHEALLDGLAAGCTPIIRDWPMLARYGGPRAVYPQLVDFVYEAIDEAVELILRPPTLPEEARRSALGAGALGPVMRFLRAVARGEIGADA